MQAGRRRGARGAAAADTEGLRRRPRPSPLAMRPGSQQATDQDPSTARGCGPLCLITQRSQNASRGSGPVRRLCGPVSGDAVTRRPAVSEGGRRPGPGTGSPRPVGPAAPSSVTSPAGLSDSAVQWPRAVWGRRVRPGGAGAPRGGGRRCPTPFPVARRDSVMVAAAATLAHSVPAGPRLAAARWQTDAARFQGWRRKVTNFKALPSLLSVDPGR